MWSNFGLCVNGIWGQARGLRRSQSDDRASDQRQPEMVLATGQTCDGPLIPCGHRAQLQRQRGDNFAAHSGKRLTMSGFALTAQVDPLNFAVVRLKKFLRRYPVGSRYGFFLLRSFI